MKRFNRSSTNRDNPNVILGSASDSRIPFFVDSGQVKLSLTGQNDKKCVITSTKFIFLLILLFTAILRLFWLNQFPPSLYTDEVNQGYNAYSILLTARDEHGILLPVSLRSFGDWKPPLSTYLMIPFVAILGLSEVSVRLPSAILGVGTIAVSYYLVKELFAEKKYRLKLALLTSYFLAISPWHILQSRAAMLVMISLFFLELGIYLFIKMRTNSKLLILSSTSFALSIYSYYGMRIITPLIVIYLVYSFRREVWLAKKELLASALLGFILFSPLIFALFNNPDVIIGRAKTVSVFYDQGVKLRQWELITQDGINYPTVLVRFFHNNIYMYGKDITRRFLSHFDGQFLFLVGDQSPPFQIPNMGILYLLDAVFIILGLIFLYKKRHMGKNLILFWFLVSFIPAAFTFMTPSSNRTFNAIVPFAIFASLGTIYLHKYHATVHGIYVALLISVLYMISFAFFLKQYFIILPQDYADWWGYGVKQLVEYVKSVEPKYENIVVTDIGGMPYIYFLFYQKYNPAKYQKEAIRNYVADQFGFEHVEGYGKFLFPGRDDWDKMKNNKLENSLYVIPAAEELSGVDYKKVIYYPNGKEAFKIFSYE